MIKFTRPLSNEAAKARSARLVRAVPALTPMLLAVSASSGGRHKIDSKSRQGAAKQAGCPALWGKVMRNKITNSRSHFTGGQVHH